MLPELDQQFEELKEYNKSVILAAELEDLLPHAEDTLYLDDTVVQQNLALTDCNSFLVSEVESAPGFLSLVGFDLLADEAANVSMIVGKPGAVYATAKSFYVAVRQYQSKSAQWPFDANGPKEVTVLHKFGLLKNLASGWYAASGVVKGRILNQFAMDEFEDHLRIATTTGKLPSNDVHSTVSVLQQQGTALVPVGLIDNIAPTEDIRSARYSGPVGFIVTFKKTDPLFVIDLAVPDAPYIKGELKIPGYSTYMHLLDDQHLLTIGYDADDQGSFAWFQGIMLQVFDVSDLANPFLLHKEVIGTRGTTSDAATNHLAFNYFPAYGWLALPMVVCEDGSGGSYGGEMTFNGLMVYEVTLADGFDYLGGVPHLLPDGQNYSCFNWWTKSNSHVKRSVFMEEYVYSVAMDEIRVAWVGDLEEPLAVIDLE